MDLRTFFERYTLEHEIVRANLINAASFDSQESFIDFKMQEISDESRLFNIARHMSVTETKLIKNLYQSTPDDEMLYRVNYNVESYAALVDAQFILEDENNAGMIHSDIVSALYQASAASGILPVQDMYVKGEDALPEYELSQLKEIYTGPIYWFYNNFKFTELRKILSRLNVKPDGRYKEDYIKQLTPLLTNPEYLKRALLTIEENEYQVICSHVKNSLNIYRKHSRWAAAKKTGLLVEVSRDYLAMHEDVLNTLKKIDFKKLDQERAHEMHLHVDDYNAYHLELKIPFEDSDIIREVYMPTGMNFYEFERVIKEAMGWKINSDSYFDAENIRIYSTEFEARNSGEFRSMIASYTQIDAVFDNSGRLVYEYNPGAGYSVNVSLKRLINIDRKMPQITAYSGPVPVDNIGGIDQLGYVLNVLNDPGHGSYIPIYQKAHSLNYRTRYPKRAINKRLAQIFNKSYPVTEFNE
ncbi:IS1096 element passenger TnpR family protein [Corticicoccus populi]|uniref:Plasmid pRiA4b Orf3-like domain-containing protein n=1 Tax=Corticicoccus populi TaxID=1812821 RepID=A0ABW5WUT8_9STAP